MGVLVYESEAVRVGGVLRASELLAGGSGTVVSVLTNKFDGGMPLLAFGDESGSAEEALESLTRRSSRVAVGLNPCAGVVGSGGGGE